MKSIIRNTVFFGAIALFFLGALACSKGVSSAECQYYFEGKGAYNWTGCKDNINRKMACTKDGESHSCKCLENEKEVKNFTSKGSPFGDKNTWDDRKNNTSQVCGWKITIYTP